MSNDNFKAEDTTGTTGETCDCMVCFVGHEMKRRYPEGPDNETIHELLQGLAGCLALCTTFTSEPLSVLMAFSSYLKNLLEKTGTVVVVDDNNPGPTGYKH